VCARVCEHLHLGLAKKITITSISANICMVEYYLVKWVKNYNKANIKGVWQYDLAKISVSSLWKGGES
jgi:hypothetical protein